MVLKKLRKDRNLKLKDVAKVMGISTQALSNYENGKRKLPISMLPKLAEALSVSVEEVLNCFK